MKCLKTCLGSESCADSEDEVFFVRTCELIDYVSLLDSPIHYLQNTKKQKTAAVEEVMAKHMPYIDRNCLLYACSLNWDAGTMV